MFLKGRSLALICVLLIGQNSLFSGNDPFLDGFQEDIFAEFRPVKSQYCAINLFNEWKNYQNHLSRGFARDIPTERSIDRHYQEASISAKIGFFFIKIFPFIAS